LQIVRRRLGEEQEDVISLSLLEDAGEVIGKVLLLALADGSVHEVAAVVDGQGAALADSLSGHADRGLGAFLIGIDVEAIERHAVTLGVSAIVGPEVEIVGIVFGELGNWARTRDRPRW
jgi:hypothetical protein